MRTEKVRNRSIMLIAQKMTAVIRELAAQHELDLTRVEAHLRLEQEGYLPLVIETIGKNQVSIAHYRQENGDLVADPEVIFFTGKVTTAAATNENEAAEGWIPFIIQMPYDIYTEYAMFNYTNHTLTHLNTRGISELVEFVEMWADNIRAQGWLNPEQVQAIK